MAQLLKLIDGTIMMAKGKQVYESILSGVIKQVDVNARKMTMIGTDETRDRDGDIIELNGWRLEDYRKNPVFLWAHNYSSVPLARTVKLTKKREPKAMEFQMQYPTKGLHPFADMILELYGEQMINASSVGFIPWEWEDIQDENGEAKDTQKGKRRFWNARRYKDHELLELSGCAVPSNPNALQNALKGKAFMDKPFEEVQRWLQGQALPPRPKMEDDVLAEICSKEADFEDETKAKQVQVPLTFCEVVDETKTEKEEVKEEVVEEKKEAEPETKETECPSWDGKLEGLEIPPYDEKDAIKSEDVLKPYPNEHACRLADPGKFDRFARKNCYKKHDGKCIDFIFGFPKDGGGELQAMRYGKDVWTASAAKTHCGSHKGSFEAAGGSANVEEISMELILACLKGLGEQMTEFMKTAIEGNKEILEALKTLKSTGADPANQPNGQSSDGGEKGKTSVSKTILDEAFKQGKEKLNPTSPSPVQYNVGGVLKAIEDLRNQLKPLKGE